MKASLVCLAVALLSSALSASALEPLQLSLSKLKGVELRLYGFVEVDLITDTKQGFTESQGNTLVPKDNTFAGAHYRTQMSVRQTRLGFDFLVPKTDAGFVPEGVLEIDFLGNNAPNTAPGATPGAQTERDFYNNPAARIRHAYFKVTKGEWSALAGQTWALFGWGAEYFPPSPSAQATPGHTGARYAQLRLTGTHPLSEDFELTGAAAVSKPASMNSGSPMPELGLKVSLPRRASNYVGGPVRLMEATSLSANWLAVPVQTNGLGNPTGMAAAVNAFVALIPSKDGKDRSNNLAFVGQILAGEGFGGLELASYTAGVPAVTAAQAGTALDSGVAGINNSGEVELIKLRAFRGSLEYTLPDPKWTVGAGYAQVETRNLSRFSATPVLAAALSPKKQFGFVSAFYEPFDWLRLSVSLSQTRDTYNDAAARFAQDNRMQWTAFFLF